MSKNVQRRAVVRHEVLIGFNLAEHAHDLRKGRLSISRRPRHLDDPCGNHHLSEMLEIRTERVGDITLTFGRRGAGGRLDEYFIMQLHTLLCIASSERYRWIV